MYQLDLFDIHNCCGRVISEFPYVKILGSITWQSDIGEYVALAQVDEMLARISVRITHRPTDGNLAYL